MNGARKLDPRDYSKKINGAAIPTWVSVEGHFPDEKEAIEIIRYCYPRRGARVKKIELEWCKIVKLQRASGEDVEVPICTAYKRPGAFPVTTGSIS